MPANLSPRPGDVLTPLHGEFARKMAQTPGLPTLLREVARRARWSLLFDGVVLVAGIALAQPWLVATGVGLGVLTFGSPLWKNRYAHRFNRMLRALAFGQWDEAARLLALFRRRTHPETIEVSIPFYDAQIRARQGHALAPLLARLDLLRPRFPPEQFHSRSASVHSAAKDYDGFLACMRAAWEAKPEDSSRQVDYALANARLGDLVQAQEIISGIDIEALAPTARSYVWWTRGLVELRNDKPSAQDTLTTGVQGFLAVASPAALSSLALCSGACALAMHRNGDAAGAKALVARVWPVLKVHADTRLRAEIAKEIGVS